MLACARNKCKSKQIAGTRACPMGGAAEAWGARDNAGAGPTGMVRKCGNSGSEIGVLAKDARIFR